MPPTAEVRIEHLEHLVLTLLKSHQDTQGRLHAASSSIAKDCTNDKQTNVINNDHESHANHAGSEANDMQTTTNLARSASIINTGAGYKQRFSVDEAHWAVLLNEVGSPES